VLRTRSPRAHTLYCYRMLRVRLACVKHAASVRSEPGSNSRLKSGVSTVTVSGLHRAATIDTNFKSLGLSQFALLRYTWNKAVTKRVLACIIRLSKSRYSQVNWKNYRRTPILQKHHFRVKQ
jgi:hypothetical protein